MKVGDTVLCKLYNKPDGRFYGEAWEATILQVFQGEEKPYLVTRLGATPIRIHYKEIQSIVRGK